MGDPIPRQHEILGRCFRLQYLRGRARDEAIAELEEWLSKPARRMRPI